jgi:hypothetical protein
MSAHHRVKRLLTIREMRRIAGRVLEAEAKIGIAEGYPAAFPAPAHVNDPLLVIRCL